MDKFDFFGVNISATNIDEAKKFVESYDFDKPGYISFPDTYVITLCDKDPQLKNILNNSVMTLPDGKPSALYGKKLGYKNMNTVSGYWLCKALLDTSLSHYFFGSTNEKLEKMIDAVKTTHPDANIVGYSSPPFITEEDARLSGTLKEEFQNINLTKPDLIWIGMSSPKQDFVMHHHLQLLSSGLMLGVGGVFDYVSGEVKKSPEWVKKIGLRWLWRLAKEPCRLGPKYFFMVLGFSKLLYKSLKKRLILKQQKFS